VTTTHTVLMGDVLRGLRAMPEQSVQCVITSPPYYGLRSYLPDDHPEKSQEIGLETTPEEYVAHLVAVFREVRRVLRDDGVAWLNLGDSYNGSGGPGKQNGGCIGPTAALAIVGTAGRHISGLKPKDLIGIPWRTAFALQADGWYLRAAPTWTKANGMPESVTDRPTVSHEYWFLLAKSGAPTFWTHRDGAGQRTPPEPDYRWIDRTTGEETAAEPGGWRDELLPDETKRWRRKNLWKGTDYFYDADAVRKPLITADRPGNRRSYTPGSASSYRIGTGHESQIGSFAGLPLNPAGRNRRTTDWWYESVDALIGDLEEYVAHLKAVREGRGVYLTPDGMPLSLNFPTRSFKGAHFATFNVNLITPLILASTSEMGCCPACGAPWRRVVETIREHGLADNAHPKDEGLPETDRGKRLHRRTNAARAAGEAHDHSLGGSTTVGWAPTCTCSAGDPIPCTVLDPFLGSGTVAEACKQHGRSSVGCDIDDRNLEYIQARLKISPASLDQVLGLAEYRVVRV